MERDERTDEPEREVERLEHESRKLGDDIDQARSEWESRKSDASVPGAVDREDTGRGYVGDERDEALARDDDDEDADGEDENGDGEPDESG